MIVYDKTAILRLIIYTARGIKILVIIDFDTRNYSKCFKNVSFFAAAANFFSVSGRRLNLALKFILAFIYLIYILFFI